jgi:hypothetical protein
MPRDADDYDDPPSDVEVQYVSCEKMLHGDRLSQLPVLPRSGELVDLGSLGSFEVIKVRHGYADRKGTASPLLARIILDLR